MNFIYEKFIDLPVWARWFTAFAIFSILGGLEQSWGERRFVAAFAEATLAFALHWLVIGLSVGGGIWSGTTITKKTKSTILGWIVGISVSLFIGVGVGMLILEIPGVGWRYDRMLSSE